MASVSRAIGITVHPIARTFATLGFLIDLRRKGIDGSVQLSCGACHVDNLSMATSAPKSNTTRGETGKTGPAGPSGPRGAAGPAGPVGPSMARADILAVVEDQFYDVRQRLDVQLERTSQIQAQIDAQHKEMVALRQQVDLVHDLLKKLIAREP
jgi:hypothetical protein